MRQLWSKSGITVQNRRYWLKGFPSDLIVTHFEDKEVGDFGVIEARTEDNRLLKIFDMKETDYVMKIMENWMAPYELEG